MSPPKTAKAASTSTSATPALKKGADIDAILRGAVEGAGLTYLLLSDEPPLYLPKDGPLVQLLSGAYEDMTGEKWRDLLDGRRHLRAPDGRQRRRVRRFNTRI